MASYCSIEYRVLSERNGTWADLQIIVKTDCQQSTPCRVSQRKRVQLQIGLVLHLNLLGNQSRLAELSYLLSYP